MIDFPASPTLNQIFHAANGVSYQWNGYGWVALDSSTSNYLPTFPPATITPAKNGEVAIEVTSNTKLTFKLRGSDGVVRSYQMTLT